jgi:hypothetical protein
MAEISCRRHRFPPAIIQHSVWVYLRFTLSYRNVEELLPERGLDISYETVRSWVLKFAEIEPVIVSLLRKTKDRGCRRAPHHGCAAAEAGLILFGDARSLISANSSSSRPRSRAR